jgi:hypothetical protein
MIAWAHDCFPDGRIDKPIDVLDHKLYENKSLCPNCHVHVLQASACRAVHAESLEPSTRNHRAAQLGYTESFHGGSLVGLSIFELEIIVLRVGISLLPSI